MVVDWRRVGTFMQCPKCQRTSWVSDTYRALWGPSQIIVRHFTCVCGHVWHRTHTGQIVECTCRGSIGLRLTESPLRTCPAGPRSARTPLVPGSPAPSGAERSYGLRHEGDCCHAEWPQGHPPSEVLPSGLSLDTTCRYSSHGTDMHRLNGKGVSS